MSLILVDAAPGRAPSLHRHDYAEVMIAQEGTATFTDGVTSRELTGRPRRRSSSRRRAARVTNTGDGRLSRIDIHVADAFATQWP